MVSLAFSFSDYFLSFFFFFNDTATTEIYTFPYTTLFRSLAGPGAATPGCGSRLEPSPRARSIRRSRAVLSSSSSPPAPGRSWTTRPGFSQGFAHGAQQGLAVEWFTQMRDRARLQGSPAGLVVAVSGENDHRDSRADGGQVAQKVEAAHPRHPQIEYHAAGVDALGGLQEGFCRLERLDAEADRGQQIPDRPAQ